MIYRIRRTSILANIRAARAVFAAIGKLRQRTQKAPLVISKEWCLESARREGDAEIGAGSPTHPLRAALSKAEGK